VRASLGIAPGALVVGTAAVFRAQKRLDLWLEVARRVRQRRADVEFVIAGDGPLRRDVENKVVELGLERFVKLPGLLSDVRPLFAATDVYLMSSDFEGLPIALLEAMAMEIVPIATSVGGIPEVLADGSGGVVVPKGDVAALSEAVEETLALPVERRRALGALARRRVVDAFSTDRMMREIERVYERVAARGRKGATGGP
jgi:glycosyltransferase involved in cell wall biosynthesis